MSHYAVVNKRLPPFSPRTGPRRGGRRVAAAEPRRRRRRRRRQPRRCRMRRVARREVQLHVQSISEWAPRMIGPYCQPTVGAGTAFLAGALALEPTRMVIASGGARLNAPGAANCAAVLDGLGLSVRDTVRLIYVARAEDVRGAQRGGRVAARDHQWQPARVWHPVADAASGALPRRHRRGAAPEQRRRRRRSRHASSGLQRRSTAALQHATRSWVAKPPLRGTASRRPRLAPMRRDRRVRQPDARRSRSRRGHRSQRRPAPPSHSRRLRSTAPSSFAASSTRAWRDASGGERRARDGCRRRAALYRVHCPRG